MSAPTCHDCWRTLKTGESAWASDWKVLTDEGFRTETRYRCDECSDKGGAA